MTICRIKLIFFDETSDSTKKDYFGLCCVAIDSYYYAGIKKSFQNILIKSGWDPKQEFKGSYIFSASKGCLDVAVEKRIEIVSSLLDLNTSKSNKSGLINVYYISTHWNDHKDAYLGTLPLLLDTALKIKPDSIGGKNILATFCDERSDISTDELSNVIEPVVTKRGFTLLERPSKVKSGFHTIGVLFADIMGYLLARIETISNDAELFQNIPPEVFNTDGRIRKLKSSQELIHKVKNFKAFTAKKESPK